MKLYTLPTCGICKMIKTKLERKNLSFEEVVGEDFFIQHNIEGAPVLMLDDGTFLTELTDINKWVEGRG